MAMVRTPSETMTIVKFITELIQAFQEEFKGDTYSHWIGIAPDEEEGHVPCLYFYVQEVGLHLKMVLYSHHAMCDIGALVKEARALTNDYLTKKKAFEETQQAAVDRTQPRKESKCQEQSPEA